MIWDDHQNRCIGELSFRSDVYSVRLRRDRYAAAPPPRHRPHGCSRPRFPRPQHRGRPPEQDLRLQLRRPAPGRPHRDHPQPARCDSADRQHMRAASAPRCPQSPAWRAHPVHPPAIPRQASAPCRPPARTRCWPARGCSAAACAWSCTTRGKRPSFRRTSRTCPPSRSTSGARAWPRRQTRCDALARLCTVPSLLCGGRGEIRPSSADTHLTHTPLPTH